MSSPIEPITDPVGAPPPRAFANATGLIYQVIGLIFSMAMCCWWPASCWQDKLPFLPGATSQAASIPADDLLAPRPASETWALYAVALTFMGGLGLMAFGFGLQHDRLKSARWVMLMNGAIALFFWVYFGCAIFQFPGMARIVTSALMALVWTVCFLLAGTSHEVVLANPPTRSEQSWTSRDEDDLRRSLSPGSRDKTNP